MTYKEIVDRFKEITDQHYMLKDFGYGQLSDIKVHAQEGEADYPYLFLNYTTHNRAGVSMNYNFNMIVMDVATDEDDVHSNFLAIQSKCQQYIDDVIAELYYGYTDKPEINYTNVTYTPFKERFQDSVAGMTATITIQVPTPINQCIAPFPGEPVPTEPIQIEVIPFAATNEACNNGAVTFSISGGALPQTLEYNGTTYNITNPVGTIIQTSNETEGTRPWTITEADGTVHTSEVTIICTYEPFPGCVPVVDVFSTQSQGFDPDTGGEPPIMAQLIVLNNGGWREDVPGVGGNYYIPQSTSPITWTITGTILMEAVNPGDVINPFVIEETGTSNIIQPATLTGWPLNNTAPPTGSEFTFEATYRIENPSQTGLQLAINPDTPESQAVFALLSGANIQICEDGATPPEPREQLVATLNTDVKGPPGALSSLVFNGINTIELIDVFSFKGFSKAEFRLTDGIYRFELNGDFNTTSNSIVPKAAGYLDGNYATQVSSPIIWDTTPIPSGISTLVNRDAGTLYQVTNPTSEPLQFNIIELINGTFDNYTFNNIELKIYKLV